MPKLVAIGDSLTQGVMNGALSETRLSYPALIAEAMGLTVWRPDIDQAPNDQAGFRVPYLPGEGIPLNIKALLQYIENGFDSDIEDLQEWVMQFLPRFENYMDELEKFYEEGEGSQASSYCGIYHNLAAPGFRVLDSFKVHSRYCTEQIEDTGNLLRWLGRNDLFNPLPSAPMYRIGRRVLNPQLHDNRMYWTQITNLGQITETEGKIENLILFLGANDCLGTVVHLDMKDMAQEGGIPTSDPEDRRKQYNLTSPERFRADYEEMVRQISSAISPDTKVFVGTVPHVTIPPITRGIPADTRLSSDPRYFLHYGPFYAHPSRTDLSYRPLTGNQVIAIDRRIDCFNSIIQETIGRVPVNGIWRTVDICRSLDDLSVKRNRAEGRERELLENFFERLNISDRSLLEEEPIPSTLRFEIDGEQRRQGGLFSLDCIHPTTVGYGLIAEDFLHAMKAPEFCHEEPERCNWRIDWGHILSRDTLIQCPPRLWDDIIRAAENRRTLWNLLLFRLWPVINRVF